MRDVKRLLNLPFIMKNRNDYIIGYTAILLASFQLYGKPKEEHMDTMAAYWYADV